MKYNLSKFDLVFDDIIRKGKPGSYELNVIKQELNKFYDGDSECELIMYTSNTDKAFFGMKVYRKLYDDYIDDVFTLNNEVTKSKSTYIIELDSKLFDPLIGFTSRELTSMLLHEVGHLVQNDKANAEIIQKQIVIQQTKNRSSMGIIDVVKCRKLFEYAYTQTIEAVHSIFKKDYEEFEADRFSVEMGYGPDLESAFSKILKTRGSIRPDGKFNVLVWTLTVYKQLILRKKFIVKCMEDLNKYSGSKLDKQMNAELREELIKAHKEPIHEYAIQDRLDYINESILGKAKRSGLKAIEDDTYVYQIRIKNVDDEYEAMDIMRDINSKINIVTDYLAHEKNIPEYERQRWEALQNRLYMLRDNLSSSDSYKKSTYGLWLKLPVTERRY